jgi:hypothetical protein
MGAGKEDIGSEDTAIEDIALEHIDGEDIGIGRYRHGRHRLEEI